MELESVVVASAKAAQKNSVAAHAKCCVLVRTGWLSGSSLEEASVAGGGKRAVAAIGDAPEARVSSPRAIYDIGVGIRAE